MNRLQRIPGDRDLFVTQPIRRAAVRMADRDLRHPSSTPARSPPARLWSLQGRGGVWFCGAHFGAGFHEDGLQSGLAVAEQLGGVRRPWRSSGQIGPHRHRPARRAGRERIAA
jgi:predicted NAD/FAD-binding protein